MPLGYFLLFSCFSFVNSDIYNVKIGTDHHVNLVDSKFLSFTLDPKLLFASSGKLYSSQECKCMASALSPALLRIAGPSTSHLTFKNNSLIIEDKGLSLFYSGPQTKINQRQWDRFIKWAKTNGFELVFAVNNNERTAGVWDTSSTLGLLGAADKAGFKDIQWQLGYECSHQTIEEYLNDVDTLSVLAGRGALAGDVTNCLRYNTTDFRDYVMLAIDVMPAVLLNGNASSQELSSMSERDRKSLLKSLTKSDVPLWVTEKSEYSLELERAAEWLASLGFAARNGFSIHFRELLEEELYEPTLSFYMALLYKNLVGERVLDVDMSISKASLFAHCTSLHHKPIPGALTLYGANMDTEPARFSLKLSEREEGGDIMQFILGHDENGNIVVNSHVMYYEGDIRPVVKRVRPYKTLLINLPPKSFGFWVLANTKVDACRDLNDTQDSIEIVALSQEETRKVKRSVVNNDITDAVDEESIDGTNSGMPYENVALKGRIDSINRDLKKMQTIFQSKMNEDALKRLRRHVDSNHERAEKKLRNRFDVGELKSSLVKRLLDITDLTEPLNNVIHRVQNTNNFIRTKRFKKERKNKKRPKVKSAVETRDKGSKNENENKVKRKAKISSANRDLLDTNKIIRNEDSLQALDNNIGSRNEISRKRRSIYTKSGTDKNELSSENEIELDSKEDLKFSKILRKIKKMGKIPFDMIDVKTDNEDFEDQDETNAIVLKTKLEDDGAVIRISENPNFGFIASTLEDFLSLLTELNQNMKKAWRAVSLLQ
ncbi:unnamed protein product [Colias eurytheme]|nr:unnamed protein product [Colias eurytheme]